MKKLFTLSVILLIVMTSTAQTQQGVVKTRGRMVNDVLQSGKGLAEATIQLAVRQAVMSGEGGDFSFPVTKQKFRILAVQKQGFQLVDYSVCTEYSYSVNPLLLVMETPEQQQSDLVAAERKIHRNLQQQLQRKEAEIESLRISQKEKDSLIHLLYQQQGDNEKLVTDMAQRYSTLDYDQLDEFYCMVSNFIENGELIKADSLLNSRGDVRSSISAYNRIRDANQQEAKELTRRQQNLQKSVAYEHQVKDELVLRCKSKYDLFRLQHQRDSALYYLESMVAIDSMNMDWRFQLYNYMQEYIGDIQGALAGYEKCRRILESQQEKDSTRIARCLDAIGTLCHRLRNDEHALSFMEEALNIRLKLYGRWHEEVAVSYSNIGTLYNDLGKTDKALSYYQDAMTIRKGIYHGDTIRHAIATLYNNLGKLYRQKNKPDMALACYHQVYAIKKALLPGKYHRSIARCFNNMAIAYLDKKDYDTSLHYLQEAFVISDSVYGRRHDLTANILYNMGNSHAISGDYFSAVKCFNQALDVFMSLQNDNRANRQYETELTECCLCLGASYGQMKEYDKAEVFYKKAKDYDSKGQFTKLIDKKIQHIHSQENK